MAVGSRKYCNSGDARGRQLGAGARICANRPTLSRESLSMSPALLNKYLQASREVANHMVLTPHGFIFAPHPMLVETDREKFAIKRIVDFYDRQPTDYADYFMAAWRFKYRTVFGEPD